MSATVKDVSHVSRMTVLSVSSSSSPVFSVDNDGFFVVPVQVLALHQSVSTVRHIAFSQ